ncbi:MAG: hypothetical protein WDO71_00245 [Bacteroidota bacterium]
MKRFLITLLLSVPLVAFGQAEIDLTKLPLVAHKPHVAINGSHQRNVVSITELLKHGLQVVLDDNSFKVIQFDIIYDCHSRSLFDFSVKRYIGDKVDPGDDYLQKRVLAGDVITIDNTVIEKKGVKFKMKDFGLIISN